MRFRLYLIGALVIFATACTDTHFIIAEDDSISLYYSDSSAKEIFFASSLDKYQYHPAVKIKKSLWKVSVPSQQSFSYFYMVDGVVTLPDCQYTEYDDFGSKNCLYVKGM